MRIVVLGDLHLVSPDDPDERRRERRKHFALAWPSCRALVRTVRELSPDLVISLGDLVDWYSPANRDFALDWMHQLGAPWVVTPGNHDLAAPEGVCPRAGWAQAGVDLGNRALELDGVRALLMDSARSHIAPATTAWLNEALREPAQTMLFTHVPVNLPAVRDYILSVDPCRNLAKYLQHEPLFDQYLRGRVARVFTGHLHFAGELDVAGTSMHLLPLSVVAFEKHYPQQGQVTVLDGCQAHQVFLHNA